MKRKFEVRDGERWCLEHSVQYTQIGGRLRCFECSRERGQRWKDANNYRELSQMRFWIQKCEAVYSLGGACVMCGETDATVLQFDHIHGDGHCEGKGRAGLYAVRWIKNHTEEAKSKYQVLCANCHMRKSVREARNRMAVEC